MLQNTCRFGSDQTLLPVSICRDHKGQSQIRFTQTAETITTSLQDSLLSGNAPLYAEAT